MIADMLRPQMLPISKNVVVGRTCARLGHTKVDDRSEHIFQREFEAMSYIVENRHSQRVTTAGEIPVNDRASKDLRSLQVAGDIVKLIPLDADTGVPFPIQNGLEKRVGSSDDI